MAHYFTQAAKPGYIETPLWNGEDGLLPSLSVSDHRAKDTGLVDQHGDAIMRGPNPMGFVWR